MKKIILASASPRRKMLLEQIGIAFETISADCNEETDENMEASQKVLMLAKRKGENVFLKIPEKERENMVIISADTVVCGQDGIYGKPVSEESAVNMLLRLSGKEHSVYTGVSVISYEKGLKKIFDFYEETKVEMKNFSKDEAIKYVRTGEPMDKAGAYGIQGYGAALVSGINGDFYNVVGLPICRLCSCLYDNFGIEIYNK